MIRKIIRIVVFCALGFLGYLGAGKIFQPFWPEWNNFYTHKTFYELPQNRIQVAILGTSIVVRGISPVQLYEKYGICAYNYSTQEQPLLASYYILKEIYRRNPDSLKNVIMECYSMTRDPGEANYRKAIEPLHFSPNKFMAAKAIADKNRSTNAKSRRKYYTDMFSYIFPVINYHERWKDLQRGDFIKFSEPSNKQRMGHEAALGWRLDNWKTEEQVYLPFQENAEAEEAVFNEWSLKYLKQVADFCTEKNLNLILYKSPDLNWNVTMYIAMKRLAAELVVSFLDMNIVDDFWEAEFDFALNMNDRNHPNFCGSEKVTDFVGKFMMENFPVDNISADKKYDFMKDSLVLHKNTKNDLEKIKDTFDKEKYAAYMQKYDFEIEFIKWGLIH